MRSSDTTRFWTASQLHLHPNHRENSSGMEA